MRTSSKRMLASERPARILRSTGLSRMLVAPALIPLTGSALVGTESIQASRRLLRLSETEVLATRWAVEDGQGRILTHRLHVKA